ncbi:MAG: zf-TFIIB domain-containing protein [Cellvibrionaceae bacterium]
MDCPKCKKTTLEATEIENGLVAAQCTGCNGMLIPLFSFRYWAKNLSSESSPEINPTPTEDSDNAIICSKCSHLMLKYLIGIEQKNKLDLCSSCDDVWLDAGEWQLLKQLGIHTQLASITTDVWQSDLRKQRQWNLEKSRYEKILGKKDFSKLIEFQEWLSNHPEKHHIKQFILLKSH